MKKKTTLTNIHKNVKYKTRVTKNIVMTKILEIMDLCKIPIQDKKPRTPMDPTIPTRNSGNIDLFMDPQKQFQFQRHRTSITHKNQSNNQYFRLILSSSAVQSLTQKKAVT